MIHGGASMRRLASCHPDLQKLVLAAAEDFDFIVVCGHRGQQDQDAAVKNGTSKASWPNSRHNPVPSEAVDLAPFPLSWDDVGAFDRLGHHMLAVAGRLQIPIRWGAHFRGLVDRPHFELELPLAAA